MASITWTGKGSDANWTTAADWNPTKAAPGSSDLAVLNATLTPPGGSFTVYVNGTTGNVTVGALQWVTSSTESATIDLSQGATFTINTPATGVGISGASAYGVFDLHNANSGSTLQIGSSGTAFRISGEQYVDFANDGTGIATVYWDALASNLTYSKLDLVNFESNDRLELANTFGATSTSVSVSYTGSASSGVLTVSNNGTAIESVHLTSTDGRDLTKADWTANVSGGVLDITNPCFLRGTRIATLRGEVAVEDLHIGDLVVTTTAGALPVKWIGTRGFITKLVNEHHRVALLPVRIAAGALGEASPARDLYVSPEHMLCLDDVLIPAEKLLNGTTITRAEGFDVVQYFHIELPRHAVLYAEGAPAESFLDTGNRNMFTNVLSYLELGHDLDAPPQPACLPIVTAGEALAAVRARLAARAAQLGLATTEDDNLHLRVDGIAIRPESCVGDSVRFSVPAGARQVRLVSRSVVLADLDPASGDHRRLGICLSGMSVADSNVPLDHAGFTTGFHAAEGTHRWTQGDALLPENLTAAMPGGFVLDLKLVRTGLRYATPPQADVISLRARRPVVRSAERLSA